MKFSWADLLGLGLLARFIHVPVARYELTGTDFTDLCQGISQIWGFSKTGSILSLWSLIVQQASPGMAENEQKRTGLLRPRLRTEEQFCVLLPKGSHESNLHSKGGKKMHPLDGACYSHIASGSKHRDGSNRPFL